MMFNKKNWVLGVLFLLPLVAYLFFASGVNNFARLDVVNKEVLSSKKYKSIWKDSIVTFDNKITILSFLGGNVKIQKAYAFNLKEKIYDRYKDFKDLQFVSILLPNQEDELATFVQTLNSTSTDDRWFFIEQSSAEINQTFSSLKCDCSLDLLQSTSKVFIIDKNRNLRGRLKDDNGTIRYAYDMSSVGELSDEMTADVKVILAEYRLALKKYNETNNNLKNK